MRNIENLKKSKYDLFKKFSEGIIEEDDYKLYNSEFDKEIDNNKSRLKELDEYEVKEIDDDLLKNVVEVMRLDLENKKNLGNRYFSVKREEGESDESFYKRKNVGLKDMRRFIGNYINKI